MKTDDPFPGYTLHRFQVVESTMDEARRLAQSGAQDRTIVLADAQRAGRGRRGKMWHSPAGNVYASIILRPTVSVQACTVLSFIFALAVGHALLSLMPGHFHLAYKWPNDVLLNYKKIAGILLEMNQDALSPVPLWIIGGVGVNIKEAPKLATYPTTSLAQEGLEVTVMDFMVVFCRELGVLLDLWKREGFAPHREMWLARAHKRYTSMTVKTPQGVVEGKFFDLTPSGELILETEEGKKRTFATGEVGDD